jgi:ABC-2 type transport system permease protein
MTTQSVLRPETESATGARALQALPGILRASRARSSVEIRSFFRNRYSLVFTLSLPAMLLLVLGSIFSGDVTGTDVSFKLAFMAGIIAAGVMSVSFSGLAINIALERDDGTIRRLAATPMPRSAYFIGKLVRVVVTGVLETAVLLTLAVTLFHLPLPDTAVRWWTFAWVLVLGTVACSLLAIAYSTLIPNARSTSAAVVPPYLVLQFISGVFFPFNSLPPMMRTVAAFFPLKWMVQGLDSVFLPDSFARAEPAGVWERGNVALVLLLWTAAMLVACAMTFRWRGQRVR